MTDVPPDENLTEGERAILASLKGVDDRMRTIQRQIATRPSRDEVAGKRRVTALLVIVLLVVSVQAIDSLAVHCTPGERADRIADELLDEDVSLDSMREIARQERHALCDVALPARAHSPGGDWPTAGNLLGLAVYGIALANALVWARRPGRRAARLQDSGDNQLRRRSTDEPAA